MGLVMFKLYGTIIVVIGVVWLYRTNGGTPPTSNNQWGECYNQSYITNHPSDSRVGEPIFRIGNGMFVRKEVYLCRNDFISWINSSHSRQSIYDVELSKKLTRYIVCRDKGNDHQSCNS